MLSSDLVPGLAKSTTKLSFRSTKSLFQKAAGITFENILKVQRNSYIKFFSLLKGVDTVL